MLVAVGAAPVAHGADRVLARVPVPVPLASHGDTLAYSRVDEAGRWRLVIWANGVARDLPVNPSDRPFDVDLGKGSRGSRVEAVYSECEGRDDCVLRRVDAATGESLENEMGTLAGDTRPSAHEGHVVWRTGSTLRTGHMGNPTGRSSRVAGPLPNGWDLGENRRLLTTTGGFRPAKDRTDVHLRLAGKVLHNASSGLLSSVRFGRPTLTATHAWVAQVRYGGAGQRFVRVHLRTRRKTMATGRGGMQDAVPVGDRAAYLWSGSGIEGECSAPGDPATPCEVRLTGRLSYR